MSKVQQQATNQDAGGRPADAHGMATSLGFDDVLASIGVGTALRPLDLAAQPGAIRAAMPRQDDPAMVALDALAAWMSVQPTTSSTIEPGRPIELLPAESRVASARVHQVVREVIAQHDFVGTSLVMASLRQLAAGGQHLSDVEQARLFDPASLSTKAGEVVTARVLQAVRHDSMLADDLDRANGIRKPSTQSRKKQAPSSARPLARPDDVNGLHQLRIADPGQARESLREVLDRSIGNSWHQSQLVGVLRMHLSMDDEPLLEELLQHNEKVRSAANFLLRQLPESRLMQRIAAMGAGLVHHRRASMLRRSRTTYACPEASVEVVRDLDLDLDDTTSSVESQIPAAIIAALPLEFWRRQVDAPLDKVILAGRSEPGATPLHIHAWIKVVSRAKDADLARVVLPWATPDEACWLIPVLDPVERVEVCRQWLRDRGSEALRLVLDLDEMPGVLATELVAQLPAWSEALSVRQAVEHVQRAAPLELLPGLADQIGDLAASLPASEMELATQLYERMRWMRWRHDLGVAVRESLQSASDNV